MKKNILLELIDYLSSIDREASMEELMDRLGYRDKPIRSNLNLLEEFSQEKETFKFGKRRDGRYWKYRLKLEKADDSFYYKNWSEGLDGSRKNEIIIDGIKNRNYISFKYERQEKDGKKIYENVEPYKIAQYNGLYYLVAKHHSLLKKFYLKDITHIRLTDKEFECDDKVIDTLDKSLNIWFEDGKTPFTVVLKIREELRDYIIYRKPIHIDQEEIREDDKDPEFFKVKVEITHHNEILPFVKSLMPMIFIEEPKELKEKLENDISLFLSAIRQQK